MTTNERLALDYHKTVEGEYGCPGLSCPGVQRLIIFADEVALAAAQGTARHLADAFAGLRELREHPSLHADCITFEREGIDDNINIEVVDHRCAVCRELDTLLEARAVLQGKDSNAER